MISARAEDVQETRTQSHISPSVLEYKKISLVASPEMREQQLVGSLAYTGQGPIPLSLTTPHPSPNSEFQHRGRWAPGQPEGFA